MNRVILCGNLTKDVELFTTTSGLVVGKFSLAVQRAYANQDGEREVDFINIIVWRSTAENCSKYLKKGSKALVEGELHLRNYEDEQGNKRYVTEVVADKVEFVGQRVSNDNEATSEGTPTGLEPIEDDTLPF